MRTILTGDQYRELDRKLVEIKRQLLQPEGYPFDPEKLNAFLQRAIEGRWGDTPRWIEKDGIIYFTLISNGKTGEEWITYLEAKGVSVSNEAKSVLRYVSFKPTKAGTPYYIAVIKGGSFPDDGRTTNDVRAYASRLKMINLPADVVCLIRDNFTDEEIKQMGLSWIITMHQPISDCDGYLSVLGVFRSAREKLDTCSGDSDVRWDCSDGFAFATEKAFVA
ncbi:MAG: hypothetical protein WC827_03045 [Candidatus Paceibacterota bacterium]|jgi:hypothetical protein